MLLFVDEAKYYVMITRVRSGVDVYCEDCDKGIVVGGDVHALRYQSVVYGACTRYSFN